MKNISGITLGIVCMFLWSTTAGLIALGGKNMDPWQFICLTGLISGAGQLVYYAATGKLRGCLVMPWRLWAITLGMFVVYGLVYPLALMQAVGAQKAEASLINYGWPVLTVVFAVLWVPGTHKSWQLGVAVALAGAGLALANWDPLRELVTSGVAGKPVLPYVFAAMAAVLWAAYSALVSRWRAVADQHATSPIGFLIIGAVAAVVCVAQGKWSWSCGAAAWGSVAALSLGSYGAGYLLWEKALHRAPASTLGLMGAVLPASSMILLGVVEHAAFQPHLLVAAAVVSAAVVVGNWKRGNGTDVTNGTDGTNEST